MSEDLTFLSTRYLLGELPGDEAAAFEIRLASDQEAREALADSALLLEVLSGVEARTVSCAATASRPVVSTIRKRPVRNRFWLAGLSLVAAACLMLVVSLRMAGVVGQSSESAGVVDHEVVAVWFDLAQADDLDLADAGDDDVDETDDMPDWLMAAVLEDQATSPVPASVNSLLKEAL